MSDILLDTQATPTTPANAKIVAYGDSTTERLVNVNDTGDVMGVLSRCYSLAAQGPGFATDTYVTRSQITIPSCGMQVGQCYRWYISVSKTAAGVAQAIYTVRIGSNATVADTARIQLTATAAQAAAADSGLIIISMGVRSVSATGVIAAGVGVASGGGGLGSGIDGAGAAFDNSALAGQYVGLSIDGGAAAAWTIQHVSGELIR